MINIRTIVLLFLCLSLAACNKFDVPDEEEKPGTSNPTNPSGIDDEVTCISVEEALGMEADEWVCVAGYVVGYCSGTTLSSAVFGIPEEAPNTNMLLADTPDETRADHLLPVLLSAGTKGFRGEWNLYDNPDVLGAFVGVGGFLTSYFRTTGIKSPDFIEFLTPENPGGGGNPSGGDDNPSGGGDNPPGGGDEPPSSSDVTIPVNPEGSVVVGR